VLIVGHTRGKRRLQTDFFSRAVRYREEGKTRKSHRAARHRDGIPCLRFITAVNLIKRCGGQVLEVCNAKCERANGRKRLVVFYIGKCDLKKFRGRRRIILAKVNAWKPRIGCRHNGSVAAEGIRPRRKGDRHNDPVRAFYTSQRESRTHLISQAYIGFYRYRQIQSRAAFGGHCNTASRRSRKPNEISPKAALRNRISGGIVPRRHRNSRLGNMSRANSANRNFREGLADQTFVVDRKTQYFIS